MIRRRRMAALCVVGALVMAVGTTGITRGATSLVVTTAAGRVAGIASGLTYEWRGIPYAAPPVGSLRWRAPAAPSTWTGIRDASTFGAHCIQLVDFEGDEIGSEDCLYLNVFAPPNTKATAGLPVMVHLHPGGNAYGWGYEEASALVSRGVIVVTLNYRLGVFGGMGHPGLTAEGSLPEEGLLDQIAALRWVQRNIAAFGGNPRAVTLFGMSSGSFDTVALVASPLAVGLFSRAAVETENAQALTGQFNHLGDREQGGVDIGAAVGCNGTDAVACLRATSADALVRAAGDYSFGTFTGGAVLPRSALEILRERGAGVPLLIGSNREEASWWVLPRPTPLRSDEYTRTIQDVIGASSIGSVKTLYPLAAYDALEWNLVAFFSDAAYTCPTRQVALAAAAMGPTWRYLYTHTMENDPDQAQFRAGHSFEDPFLWHHFYDTSSGPYVPTAAEERLSATMATYWTNFAKRGDPNGAGVATWPRYDSSAEQYQVLDDSVRIDRAFHVPQCQFLDTATLFESCSSYCHFFNSNWWHRFRD